MTPNLANWRETYRERFGRDTDREAFIAALLSKALEGKSKKATWYRLGSQHVRALVKFHQAILYFGRNDIHIREDMKDAKGSPFELTVDEWTNWSYLRVFALVAHLDPDNPRSGRWKMTRLGAEFLKGTNFVPLRKLVLNGEIIDRDPRLVHVTEFRGKVPEYPKTFDHVLVPIETPLITSSLFPETKVAKSTNQESHA